MKAVTILAIAMLPFAAAQAGEADESQFGMNTAGARQVQATWVQGTPQQAMGAGASVKATRTGYAEARIIIRSGARADGEGARYPN